MRHILSSIIAIAASSLMLFAACARTGHDDSSRSQEGEDGVVAAADSDSITTKAPAEPPALKFASSQAAIDFMRKSGHWDRYSAGIIPEMAEYNLEYATKLLDNKFSRFIIVDKASMQVLLYDKYGRLEHKYGMACARNYGTKHKRADSRTPEGFFSAEGIYNSTDWLFTNDNGYTSPARGSFGPRFVRLKCPNTSQIGIHGTSAPGSIGRRASHGCIRLTNNNILELVKFVEVGMPIIVSPGPYDMAVNQREGYNIPSVAITPGGSRAVAADHVPTHSVPGKASKPAATDSTANSDTESDAAPEAPAEQTAPATPAPAPAPAAPAPAPKPEPAAPAE